MRLEEKWGKEIAEAYKEYDEEKYREILKRWIGKRVKLVKPETSNHPLDSEDARRSGWTGKVIGLGGDILRMISLWYVSYPLFVEWDNGEKSFQSPSQLEILE